MPLWTEPQTAVREAAELVTAFFETSGAAAQVILRRTQLMMIGQMTTVEAVVMVTEKATVFAEASHLAARAAANGGDPVAVARAALGPYDLTTRANAARLRL